MNTEWMLGSLISSDSRLKKIKNKNMITAQNQNNPSPNNPLSSWSNIRGLSTPWWEKEKTLISSFFSFSQMLETNIWIPVNPFPNNNLEAPSWKGLQMTILNLLKITESSPNR